MLSKKAYTETYFCISQMSDELRSKIPINIIENIKNNMDTNYQFNVEDINKLQLLEDTKKILSVIYTDYISTDEEKKVIKAKEKTIEMKKKEELSKVQVKELFANKNTEEKSLQPVPKENFFTKIYKFIKNSLKKFKK